MGLLLAGFIFTGCSSSSNDDILFSDNPAAASGSTGAETGTGTAGTTSADITSADLTAARFHVGDTVTVDFSGTVDTNPCNMSNPSRKTAPSPFPYIGPVQAVGKTAGELQNEIHDLYVPKYYVRLTVTVSSRNAFSTSAAK